MFKLRHTWITIFSSSILYDLDLCVKQIDPSWPVIKPKAPSPISAYNNCNFVPSIITELHADVEEKQKHLIELTKKKEELILQAEFNTEGKKRISEADSIKEPSPKAIKSEQIDR